MNHAGLFGIVAGIVGFATFGVLLWEEPSQRQGEEAIFIGPYEVTGKSPKREDKVVKSEAEWRAALSEEQFEILRSKGTEPRFCEAGLGQEGAGAYHCAGCDLSLFKSGEKYESGSGWPAFFAPYDVKNVWMKMDYSFGMVRVEVLCSRCDGHLGHAFEDGPKDKTGIRFCINSKILVFKKSER